jgi:L-alanine-DL-glutamate epimerase-like enolase superfamily enzyme
MQTKVTPVNRLDGIDAERFRAMLASPSFQMFMARVSAELERARTVCETHVDANMVRHAQGAIQFARMVLALPPKMLEEMKPKTKVE